MSRDFGNLRDDERCVRIVFDRDNDGQKLETKHRCKNPRMVGVTVCNIHGKQKVMRDKSNKAKAVNAMTRFVTPISADDPEADVIYGFEVEYRRTVGRIRFCDEQMAKLKPKDLTFGVTKVEKKSATEFAGVDETYEAAINMWYQMQFAERKHLLDMQKVWIGAKLDSKRLEIQTHYVVMLDAVITKSLKRLGLDSESPEIRQVIREELLALPQKGDV